MFGKPDWFRAKTVGWGLTPTRWQGWAYTLGWMSVIALPFVTLILREQPVEGCTWLAITMGALFYDVRDIRRQMQRANFNDQSTAASTAGKAPEKDVFYIGDSEGGASSLATRNYSLKLK